MAKVTGPFHSDKASGDFAKAIQFRCGKFVVKKPTIKKEGASTGQNFQRDKFKDGAEVWSEYLTDEQKTRWEDFSKIVRKAMGFFTINTPLGPIYYCPGMNKDYEQCIRAGGWNGYQYFISCYLTFGPDGWTDYPNPPSFP